MFSPPKKYEIATWRQDTETHFGMRCSCGHSIQIRRRRGGNLQIERAMQRHVERDHASNLAMMNRDYDAAQSAFEQRWKKGGAF